MLGKIISNISFLSVRKNGMGNYVGQEKSIASCRNFK